MSMRGVPHDGDLLASPGAATTATGSAYWPNAAGFTSRGQPTAGDAVGAAYAAAWNGGSLAPAHEVLEADDGFLHVGDLSRCFIPSENLSDIDGWLLDRCLGDTLDVGAGPGRLAVVLRAQDPNRRVVALDASPGALAVAQERGVETTILHDIRDDSPLEGQFDTVLLGGNNLGLLTSPEATQHILAKLEGVLRPAGRIVGAAGYPDQLPARTAAANRAAGRLDGLVHMRVRFEDLASEWFDYAFLSPSDLEAVLSRTNWCMTERFNGRTSWAVCLTRRSGKSAELGAHDDHRHADRASDAARVS